MSICSRLQSEVISITFLFCPLLVAAETTLEFWRIAYTTRDEVSVVVQTSEAATLTLELEAIHAAPRTASRTSNGQSPVQLTVGGLEAKTSYQLTLRDGDGKRIDQGKVTTAPPPRTDETITMVFVGDVPTLTDQSSLGLFSAATEVADPDLICWLGNGLSPDGFSWTSTTAYRNAALDFARTEAISRLGKASPQLHPLSATDYGPWGSNRHWSGRAAALQTYADFWPVPFRPFPNTPGIYQVRYGDIELFALDPFSKKDGFERAAARAVVFGEAQLNWLVNALATSDATFKLILSPLSLLHPRSDEASLSHYKFAKDNLLRTLREPPTEGIVIISGSDGPGELTRTVRPDGYPLFELSVGHLIHLSEAPKLYPEDNYFRVPGTLVREPHYTSITVEGAINARRLNLSFHRLDGSVIRSESLSAIDLRN